MVGADVAIVINVSDPLSVAIGKYYAAKRHIPQHNIARVRFAHNRSDLTPAEFAVLQASVLRQLNAHIQAYVLTWARPYRVGCTSITWAFAFGRVSEDCGGTCHETPRSPYYNSDVSRPYDELRIRPAMSLAAVDFAHARQLIDRGVRADRLLPNGAAYLLSSSDVQRNVRATEYPLAGTVAGSQISVRLVRQEQFKDRQDVLFAFVGALTVDGLETNRFLPGAMADHLTSFGGMLTDSPQMSSLRWLEAGATGSFGTVVEPCNYPGKFPNVAVAMRHYLAGETLLEAYWKSVAMPVQGIFIGEPLAAPFAAR